MAPPDKSNLTKARNELEEIYSGVPDDSVNLTFQDFAEVSSHPPPPPEKKKTHPPPQLIVKDDASPRTEEVSPLANSLDDFSLGYEGSSRSDHPIHQNNQPYMIDDSSYTNSPAVNNKFHRHTGSGNTPAGGGSHPYMIGGQTPMSPYTNAGFSSANIGAGGGDEISRIGGGDRAGGRRRPGIPHSNICTVCSTYIYLFRHRCLVCGRVYCRQCVSIGMGEMSEGRKCIECLGRRFSQRYIQQAGHIGCCAGYSGTVKQQELSWAEKGARKSGENRYGDGGMLSSRASRSPAPSTPSRTPITTAPSSFVMNSPYSPYYAHTSQALPF